jgi:hypothetical protein
VIGIEPVGNKIDARAKAYARSDRPTRIAGARRLAFEISRETNTKRPPPDVLEKPASELKRSARANP